MRFKNYWLDFHYKCYKFTYVISSKRSFTYFFVFSVFIYLFFFACFFFYRLLWYSEIHCCDWNANHRHRRWHSMETSAFWSSFKLFHLLLLISPSSPNWPTMHKSIVSNIYALYTEYNFIVNFPIFFLFRSHCLLLLDIFMCWLVFAHVVSNFLEWQQHFHRSNMVDI